MIFSTHNDAPVAFPDSMRVLSATVTRRSRSGDIIGPTSGSIVMTALKAMTIWPAYQHFEEDTKGSIEVGKLADFVILSGDPIAIDPETLDRFKVVETIKEGVTVYAKPTDAGGGEEGVAPISAGAKTRSVCEHAGRCRAVLRTRPGAAASTRSPCRCSRPTSQGPHDPNCVYNVLFDSLGQTAAKAASR